MPHLPLRSERDLARGQRAYDAAIASGARVMDAAIAKINAACSEAAVHNRLKLCVERVIQRGAGDPEVRARYRARARELRRFRIYHVDSACHRVKYWLADETKVFAVATACGLRRPPRLSVSVLKELHLILRFVRRYHAGQYRVLLDDVNGDAFDLMAAE